MGAGGLGVVPVPAGLAAGFGAAPVEVGAGTPDCALYASTTGLVMSAASPYQRTGLCGHGLDVSMIIVEGRCRSNFSIQSSTSSSHDALVHSAPFLPTPLLTSPLPPHPYPPIPSHPTLSYGIGVRLRDLASHRCPVRRPSARPRTRPGRETPHARHDRRPEGFHALGDS